MVVTKQDRLARLGEVPMFTTLTKKELRALLDASNTLTHEAGHEIISQGAKGFGFQLILEGEVKVVRNGRTVARLGPGDFFGEISLIDEGVRSASIVADSDVTAMLIPSWELRPLVNHHPQIAWKLMAHLASRLREEQSARDAATC